MVYFNCCSCNTGLRKNQVEQHMYSCRSRMVSCIDCSKDFRNDEYKQHVKCITESEKYESKSSFVSKANKGDLKQNAWLEKVGAAVESFRGSQRARQLLEKLTDFPNVPRKKQKFFNFMFNSFRSYGVNESQLEEIWSVIEQFDKQSKIEAANNKNVETAAKRKVEESDESEQNKRIKQENNEESESFDWATLIKNECCKHPNNEIILKKLEKKIYKKYEKFLKSSLDNESNDTQTNLIEKFSKKLNKKLKKFSFILLDTNKNQDESTVVKYVDDNNGTTLIVA